MLFPGDFFSSQGFIPHGHCYLWKPSLVWLHIVSDSAIALAYFSIPITLIYFVSKRKTVPFNWIFWLFGAFIIACGAGHVMNIWTLWNPSYWASGVLKAVTAIISAITAVELIPLVPKVLALPDPIQLEATNRELEEALQKLQQAQLRLIQTEKMSSLGQLVAGVAHEINNPVNFIHGNLIHTTQYTCALLNLLELYQQSYPQPTPKIQQALEDSDLDFLSEDLPKVMISMRVGTDRIRQLVLSLRNFARLDESETKLVNLHEGIESTLLILQNYLKPKPDRLGIVVCKEYGDLSLVECYAGQLNQVFMNLLSNAIDALEKQRQIPVRSSDQTQLDTHLSEQEVPTIRIQTEKLDAEWVSIQISDNGAGMPENVQRRIFNPFFTTKPVGKGTGLGLSISYQIVVEKHGGYLDCTSTPGEGTTFQIKIPMRQRCEEIAATMVSLQVG